MSFRCAANGFSAALKPRQIQYFGTLVRSKSAGKGVGFAGAGIMTDRTIKGQKQSLCHYTILCRSAPLLKVLPDILLKHFPQGAPIYSYGAANGQEAYSLMFRLIDALGEEQAARYPIEGLEINPDHVKEAQSARWFLNETDIEHYNSCMKSPWDRFMTYESANPWDTIKGNYTVRPAYQNRIAFKQGDIQEALKTRFKEPVIMSCANVLYQVGGYPFGSPRKQKQMIKQLYRALPPKSLLMVGLSDEILLPALAAYGFKPRGTVDWDNYIFERPEAKPWRVVSWLNSIKGLFC